MSSTTRAGRREHISRGATRPDEAIKQAGYLIVVIARDHGARRRVLTPGAAAGASGTKLVGHVGCHGRHGREGMRWDHTLSSACSPGEDSVWAVQREAGRFVWSTVQLELDLTLDDCPRQP